MKKTGGKQVISRSYTRRDFLSTSLKAGAAAFTTGLLPKHHVNANGQYNVLFIVVDDLRPLLGCYGHTEMHTPNIDRLAERGTLFNRAYCQNPLCSPSRTSFFTGLRPETVGVTNNKTFFRETVPDVVTLPQHFKTNGYHTQSIGKVAHIPTLQDDGYSWSTPSWRPQLIPFDHETTPSWQALDVEEDALRDGKTAKRAVEVLEQVKDQQFFLAVGFYKPHLPYNAPKQYFELYENVTFDLSAISRGEASEITPPHWNEARPFEDIPDGIAPLSYDKILELTRAYAAATSYTDAQVGRVLNQLDALGLTENTVIVFCGDHGYNLGENGTWGKNVIVEASLRSPLIVSVPGQELLGTQSDALVELVDIFPTLCDTCQIPILSELEGLSMLPVIEQPTRPWKTAAFSQRNYGATIRTERYRYTEFQKQRELYDYSLDPNSDFNIAHLPENAELVAYLKERLHAGWQEALPEEQGRIPPLQMLPWDINDDGIVDIQDLLLVSKSFGAEILEYPKVDVNQDGNVDIVDLLLVAAHFGESVNSTAPTVSMPFRAEHVALADEWLTEARLANDGSDLFQKGIAILERLINTTIPTKTVLLPNYPNPFNPETWIPYDLAEDAYVHIHIYNLKGESIRRLPLGFQTAGTYRSQSRAAYWDGCNAAGESVASGVYFYTLQVGDSKTTRQMVILK